MNTTLGWLFYFIQQRVEYIFYKTNEPTSKIYTIKIVALVK